MDKITFDTLPSSTNAVESHNRLCKSEHVQILKVAMMTTYRKDMSTSLELMAQSRGLPTTYDDLTHSAREKRSQQQSASRRKRLCQDPEDDPMGPPDSKKAFQQGTQSVCVIIYSDGRSTTCKSKSPSDKTPSRKKRKKQETLITQQGTRGMTEHAISNLPSLLVCFVIL